MPAPSLKQLATATAVKYAKCMFMGETTSNTKIKESELIPVFARSARRCRKLALCAGSSDVIQDR